jgi:hypothetical protein
MRKLITLVAAAALVAAAVPAAAEAAKRIPYKGKTNAGQKVTFKFGGGKAHSFATGVRINCLPIQGTGTPNVAVEPWTANWIKVPLKPYTVKERSKPATYYNEVEKTHTISMKRGRNGVISGSIRTHYQYLIPKYPIGTFSIYSCLGVTTFKAKPAR